MNKKGDVVKVIFLDFDGVINSELSRRKSGGSEPPDREAVLRVKKLCEKHNAKLVISSTRRIGRGWYKRCSEELARGGWENPPIIGKTPELDTPRGEEIAAWLWVNPWVATFVIIDDDDDMLPRQLPFFVETEWMFGFTEADAEKADGILSR